MPNRYRTLARIALAAVLAFAATPTRAQMVEASSRPSMSLFVLESPGNSAHIAPWREFDLRGSYLAERSDVDLFATLSLRQAGADLGALIEPVPGGERVVAEEFADAVSDVARETALGHHMVRHLFEVGKDHTWSIDRLAARAQYAQTTAEASVDLTSMRGGANMASDRALDGATRAYAVVLLPEVTSHEVVETVDGRKRTRRVTQAETYHVALLKLGYDTAEDVRAGLGDYYCDEDCDGRADAFARSRVPLELVWSGAVENDTRGEPEPAAVLKEVIDEVVRQVPALQYEALVLTDRPIASRIGRKEGVRVGRRYEVVRQFERDGDRVRRRRGYVRARRVADNRGAAVTRTASGEEVLVAYDPSTFVQVHGRDVEPMDVLVENPDIGLNIQAGARWGSYPALGVDVLQRVPMTVSTLVGLTGEAFYEDSDKVANVQATFGSAEFTEWMTLRGGLAVGQELFLMRGNLRVLPYASGGVQGSMPTSSSAPEDAMIRAFTYRAGINTTLQIGFSYGLFAGASYQGLFAEDYKVGENDAFAINWDDYFSNGQGVQFEGGVRVNL